MRRPAVRAGAAALTGFLVAFGGCASDPEPEPVGAGPDLRGPAPVEREPAPDTGMAVDTLLGLDTVPRRAGRPDADADADADPDSAPAMSVPGPRPLPDFLSPPPDLPGPHEVSTADSVPVARSPVETLPARAGMAAEGLRRVDSILLAAVIDSVTPGAALAVGRRGRIVRLRGYGWLDWSEGSRIVTPGTLYDLASLTKAVGTTTAVMLLAEDGRLRLDHPVTTYLPWWLEGDPRRDRVTVRDLLLHRSGLAAWLPLWREHEGDEAFRDAFRRVRLQTMPGRRTLYSDLGFMTLAWVVEAASGMPLDEFLEEEVWEPLGMSDTGFRPRPALLDRIAPTEVDSIFRDRHLRGEVHDENAWAAGGVAGQAGLFSTAWDLAILAQTLLDQGRIPGCGPEAAPPPACGAHPVGGESGGPEGRLVASRAVRCFVTPGGSTSRALGWDTPSGRSSAGDYFSPSSFGHTGFTGTSIWIDPERELFVVLLTNRVNPTRANRGHVELRRAVHDAVALAVADEEVQTRAEIISARRAGGGGGGAGDGGAGDGDARDGDAEEVEGARGFCG